MRIAPAPIAPIIKERVVPLAIDLAFELFTERMSEWWPLATHSIGGSDVAHVRFEPVVGGRIVEVHHDGTEHNWADVLAWDPPERLVVAWHPSLTPDAASILEVRFSSVDEGTALWLEHRGWEEFGEQQGEATRAGYDTGWNLVLTAFLDNQNR